MFYVYIHRRATDGMPFYVGKGQGRRAYSPKDRNKHWRHIDAKHGRFLQFIDSDLSENQAFELEGFLIEFIGRADLGSGPLVNMTDGGEGHAGYRQTPEAIEKRIAPLRGRKRTDEQRARMSESMKGIRKSAEHREKIRQSMLAKPRNENFRTKVGHSVSLETRKKIKASCPHARRIRCVETGKIFDCLADAAKWLVEQGHTKATPSSVSSGYRRRQKRYGYTWEEA